MNTGIIVGMATLTVASAVTEKILLSIGRTDEATYMNLATKSGITITALSVFAKLIKSVLSLG